MGREEELEYAEKHGITVKQKKDKPYSYDENMWANTGVNCSELLRWMHSLVIL